MRRFLVACCLGLMAAGCTGGEGDGEPEGVTVPEDLGPDAVAELGSTFTVIGTSTSGLATPRDLAFHPERGELWTVNRETDGTVIYFDPGMPSQTHLALVDGYALHFMEEVSSITFADGLNEFGTCQETRNTYNEQAPPNDFMGPTLWSADLAIYAQEGLEGQGELGSHLDMLHQSPECMGIAWDDDRVYWVFDGHNGHLVYYDFQEDHGPGHDDHADGIVRRYTEVELTRVPDVTSDVVLDQATGLLYIADTGTGRVLWVDTATGSEDETLPELNEPLAEFTSWDGVEHGVLVRDLAAPSGLAIDGNRLFVTENGTGAITVFDLADGGNPLGRLGTGAQSIMGVAMGPDGKLWYVDADADEVVRIDD